MRCITYAGETVITTDDVAEALVELTAAIATLGAAEAVSIPIVFRESDEIGEAELVIGVGNDVLSVPVEWEGAEPDSGTWGIGHRPSSPAPRSSNRARTASPCAGSRSASASATTVGAISLRAAWS